ncbi:hypothetical protein Harman_23750 [Haloarcula mannanilytica]|uniref:Uncharacterized protein n=1 Tax=Haloarcula mannanilytica TaxID=2509225 RepID=A0A4C2EM44_9EURY|nr:hypothetical protein [Haloarcula mannanilytica]GCF14440.1 hypothetical protein Harman_23750 [Haloarcula mannanilytica]
MQLPTREEFVQRVRRFDQRKLTRFVADLYEARGWTVETVDCGRLSLQASQGTPGETLDVRVTEGSPTTRIDADRVVVGTTTDIERVPDDARVVDARELHGMALYAINRDQRRKLLADHFESRAFVESRSVLHRITALIPALPSFPTRAGSVALVVILMVASVALVATASFDRSHTPDRDAEPTVTPVSVSQSLFEASTDTGTATPASVACPRAPTDAHPASLRPVPVDAALSVGLEGWEDVRQLNASRFQGPDELTIPWRPDVRHESTYRSPRGTTITLVIDQWSDRQSAVKAGDALANNYPTALVWGRYTFAVVFPDSPSDSTNANVDTNSLLSEVIHPERGKLGSDCVDALTVPST